MLEIRDLTFAYPGGGEIIRNMDLSVPAGEFVTVFGATGSGKSTFLRLLKKELAPVGDLSGEILFRGERQIRDSAEGDAGRIGFVAQSPEEQIVTESVWHELAFGLENMSVPAPEIKRRIAETAAFFGIEPWYEKKTSDLSGGQKQLLNLASVMVTSPELLILDEPTAQMDPVSASEFISVLRKINTELSVTVIISEHRLEELIGISDRLVVMKKGGRPVSAAPSEIGDLIADMPELSDYMPAPVRLFRALGDHGAAPLNIVTGRKYIRDTYGNSIRSLDASSGGDASGTRGTALEFSGVFFSYGRDSKDVLRNLSFSAEKGEALFLLGGNGSGKTTAMCAAAGILRPYSGKIRIFGKNIKEYKGDSLYDSCVSMLPQEPETLFLRSTVLDELRDCGLSGNEEDLPFDLTELYGRHPYDLSGGEKQLLAITKVLSRKPKILLMDEPTKGLDVSFRRKIEDLVRVLKAKGVTVVVITHDTEFAAECADRCVMFFRGEAVCCEPPSGFFLKNSFYTTSARKMTDGYYDGIVTLREAEEICRINGKKQGDDI